MPLAAPCDTPIKRVYELLTSVRINVAEKCMHPLFLFWYLTLYTCLIPFNLLIYLFILIIPQLLSQYISNQTETRTVVRQYVLYFKTGPIFFTSLQLAKCFQV